MILKKREEEKEGARDMPGERKARNKNLTVPNALSVLRILVVPFFAWRFLKGDLVTAAVNEALRAAAQEKEERMGALSGGMNLPGMF